MQKALAGSGAQLAWLVPELASISGAPPPEHGDAASDRIALHRAITEALTRLSRVHPLLLVADDFHWADPETLHLLRHLARTAPEAPLLLVAAYRDRGEETDASVADTLADVSRLEGTTRLSLENLRAAAVGTFMSAAVSAETPIELAVAIEELTGGTPFFLCELLRELRASKGIEVSETGRLRLTRPLADVRGPKRTVDLVEQRLARLPRETTAMVELAAVAGTRFELRLLAEAGGDDLTAVADALEHCRRSGLIEEVADAPPAGRFTHELVRRAVYDRLRILRRARLHLQVGETLERLHQNDLERVLPELAHHFTLAAPIARPERGIDYNVKAAKAALAKAAVEEGAAHLQRAAQLQSGITRSHRDPREPARIRGSLPRLS
jgi:predicted ATPase